MLECVKFALRYTDTFTIHINTSIVEYMQYFRENDFFTLNKFSVEYNNTVGQETIYNVYKIKV